MPVANEVAVAVTTYRRPELLSKLLAHLLVQCEALPLPARVVVVDNDPDQSARPVVDSVGHSLLTYVAEPEPGVAAARNAALDASAGCRLLAFIDDDEVPVDHWLASLVGAWETWGCDAVSGPTVRTLGGSAGRWVRTSGFFDIRSRPDGARVAGAGAGNLLLDLESVRRLGLRFDPRFGLTGGEDTLFTRQLTAAGGVIRWCDEAVATEPVPPERATRAWVLQRELRTGSTWSRVQLTLAAAAGRPVRTSLRLVATSLKLTGGGAVRLARGLLRDDRTARATGQRELWRGCGVLVGVLGGHVQEYRRAA